MAANDLLDRYLYAVSRYLPAHRQGDLLAELSANLHAEQEDKEAEFDRPLTEDEQADLLRRHGHPLLVAARYQPQRSLIGPEVFPFYWFTVKRVLPWVVGIYLLVMAVTIIFGSPSTPIAQHLNLGHLVTGLFGAIFQFLAIFTAIFALLELFKGKCRNDLAHPLWDPRKLPKANPLADQDGPHHPYADAIASVVFLAWLLAFPRYPVLIFGPYVSWHLLSMDLPSIWHQFYWLLVGFSCIQVAARAGLLFQPVRRYYHFMETVLHMLAIGIIASLLRVHDYMGEAIHHGPSFPMIGSPHNIAGNPMSPDTVATLNLSIHSGLLLVLIIAVAKFLWDTVQWLRPRRPNQVSTKIGAPSQRNQG